jgi:nucleotide sugar dehydrogenase
MDVFSLKIMQVGCGVVGGAYIRAFKDCGFDIAGVDVCPPIIEQLKEENIEAYYPSEIPEDLRVNMVLTSVPTPLIEATQRLDMTYVYSTLPLMKKLIMQSADLTPVIILRSTLPPGETKKYYQLLQESLGPQYSNSFRMVFQPEFLRARSAYEDACSPWRVVFGIDPNSVHYESTKQTLTDVFTKFVQEDMIYYLNIEEAEYMKLVHNFSNGMKISYANTIYGIAKDLPFDIDATRVISIVSNTAESFLNKNYGLTPGKPYGGTCLPKDIPELTMLARDDSPYKSFIHSTTTVNKYIADITQETPEIGGLNWVSNKYLSEVTKN